MPRQLKGFQKEFLNKCTDGLWECNSLTGIVDVNGNFQCEHTGAKNLQGIEFGRVSGAFDCSGIGLRSLKGVPREVGGFFHCSDNLLTSLAGSPLRVGGGFDCRKNGLQSLVGAPKEVGGDFACNRNSLSSLVGGPSKVGAGFHCHFNKLENLIGAPQEVGGDFNCSGNRLVSLIGAPQKMGGDFYCSLFLVGPEKWNSSGWMGIWKNGSPQVRKLIVSLLTPDLLNWEIEKDPQGMLQKLVPLWDFHEFAEVQKGIVFPPEFDEPGQIIRDLQRLDSLKDLL